MGDAVSLGRRFLSVFGTLMSVGDIHAGGFAEKHPV